VRIDPIKAAKGGHIVSTASLGGFQGLEAALIYCASKAAVISLMEGYRPALQKFGIGVSVLCPANIKSNMALSADTRPSHLRKTGYLVNDQTKDSLQGIYQFGMDPVDLAQHVKAGIDANDLYIIPYPEARSGLEKHFGEITASIPPVESDPEGVVQFLQALPDVARVPLALAGGLPQQVGQAHRNEHAVDRSAAPLPFE
jgi:short-subunit dehydrogenase